MNAHETTNDTDLLAMDDSIRSVCELVKSNREKIAELKTTLAEARENEALKMQESKDVDEGRINTRGMDAPSVLNLVHSLLTDAKIHRYAAQKIEREIAALESEIEKAITAVAEPLEKFSSDCLAKARKRFEDYIFPLFAGAGNSFHVEYELGFQKLDLFAHTRACHILENRLRAIRRIRGHIGTAQIANAIPWFEEFLAEPMPPLIPSQKEIDSQ
jgi:hypothetical protein